MKIKKSNTPNKGEFSIYTTSVWPRSLDQFYKVTHHIKWVKTSWTYRTNQNCC